MSDQTAPPLTPRARLRWPIIKQVVTAARPDSILELGCGLGAVGVRLARIAAYTAAEPDDRCWGVAHERITPLGGTVLHGDHHKVPEDGRYDLVCAFEVLEHIFDDAGTLAEWLPLVRPGGTILLSVPADPEKFGPSDELVGHYRRYTEAELAERLTDAGAVDVTVRRYGWPVAYLLDSVRDRMAARKIATAAPTAEERTHTSGRLFQPQRYAGALVRAAMAPFGVLQNVRPDRGPGLIAWARRPEEPAATSEAEEPGATSEAEEPGATSEAEEPAATSEAEEPAATSEAEPERTE